MPDWKSIDLKFYRFVFSFCLYSKVRLLFLEAMNIKNVIFLPQWMIVVTQVTKNEKSKDSLQRWSEQRVLSFHNNIFAGHASLPQVYRSYWTYDRNHNSNLSPRFRPLGLRVMALSIKCESFALRSESREEWIFRSNVTGKFLPPLSSDSGMSAWSLRHSKWGVQN